jgi:cellulose synthase/poly-beta-1,6-N-acetylglucosamine synthase-like glycosyltransferase
VVAAYHEQGTIARRVRELTRQIADAGLTGEVLAVSDGSTDATAEVARACDTGAVPLAVLIRPHNEGKAAALSAGCDEARYDVIALAYARQTWAPDTLERLLENFADPEVGAVGGKLFVESTPGVMAGVGLYWRYEKALRRMESLVRSTIGATGAVCAVRRSAFRPVPSGTVLDDVYWPLRVVMGGHRVVFDGRARAFDRLPDAVGAEFRRKVRTLAGNFQLVARLPGSVVPGLNPIAFGFVSHKLMRLAVSWAWLAAAVLAEWQGGTIYPVLLGAQWGSDGARRGRARTLGRHALAPRGRRGVVPGPQRGGGGGVLRLDIRSYRAVVDENRVSPPPGAGPCRGRAMSPRALANAWR